MGTRIQESVTNDVTVAVADIVTKYTLSFISQLSLLFIASTHDNFVSYKKQSQMLNIFFFIDFM